MATAAVRFNPSLVGDTKAIVNQSYAILPTDGAVAFSGLTGPVTATLPDISLMAEGQMLNVFDVDGSVTAGANTVSVTRSGTATIRGINTRILNSARAGLNLIAYPSLNQWWYTSNGTIA